MIVCRVVIWITFITLGVICLSDIRTSLLDLEFRDQLDLYIQNNIEEVKNKKQFYNLPRIQVEVVGQ